MSLTSKIKSSKLAAVSKDLQKLVRNSICLTTIDENEEKLGASKLGGYPDLPPDTPWPRYKSSSADIPFGFVGQVSLQDIAGLNTDHLPIKTSGILYFFFELTLNSLTSGDQTEMGKVIYYEGDSDNLTKTDPPEDMPAYAAGDKIFYTCKVEFSSIPTLPSPSELDTNISISDEARSIALNDKNLLSAYSEFHGENFQDEKYRGHRMFGYPYLLQGEVFPMECVKRDDKAKKFQSDGYGNYSNQEEMAEKASDWILLFQVSSDSNTGFMWGDGGMLYYYIEKSRLEKMDFSNVKAFLGSG